MRARAGEAEEGLRGIGERAPCRLDDDAAGGERGGPVVLGERELGIEPPADAREGLETAQESFEWARSRSAASGRRAQSTRSTASCSSTRRASAMRSGLSIDCSG